MTAGKAIMIFWAELAVFYGGIYALNEMGLEWALLPLAIGFLWLVVWTYGKLHFS